MPGRLLQGGRHPLFCLYSLLLPLVSLHSLNQQGISVTHRPKLLLVSFDGFRWDYIDRVPTPNFKRIIDEGVMVTQVKNVFVTKTFPNHYTLVTGLYPETHGIVANEMYDPAMNRSFSADAVNSDDSQWWEEAVPLWVTLQKAGWRTGAAMWPGTYVKIHGMFPDHYLPYNASVSFETRVERIIEWFSAPDGEAVDFGALYWEEPDASGHRLGPESPLMDGVIADIDEKVGFLMNELKKAGLYERVNLIVTSDHGMAQLSIDKIIELDEYVSRDLYTMVDWSPVVSILPKKGKLDEVYSKLVDANPNMVVHKKEDIPAELHYQHNARIMPIIVEANEGWTIMQNRNDSFMLGGHGFRNNLRSMQPVFVARGPAFCQQYVKPFMHSVDLYPLMCHILSVRPLPNNGSLLRVRDLLSQEPAAPSPLVYPGANESSYASVVGSFFGAMMVLAFLGYYIKQVTFKQLPSRKRRRREMSQPLLQEDLHL